MGDIRQFQQITADVPWGLGGTDELSDLSHRIRVRNLQSVWRDSCKEDTSGLDGNPITLKCGLEATRHTEKGPRHACLVTGPPPAFPGIYADQSPPSLHILPHNKRMSSVC